MATTSNFAKGFRSLMLRLRIAGVIILLAVLVMGAFQLYDFYKVRVGVTPVKTIESYFVALGQGNYDEVYRLTSKQHLTDIYGRPITQDEFRDQLRKLTGGRNLPFERIETARIFDRSGSHFYRVTLHSTIGGRAGQSSVVVEVRREENTWVILYPFAILI
ncbi:MAG TPA: hypothetical protein GX702_05975 [Chloroflexi bacterium]|jgi:hypothetical protein|nr:hypothetical protein [Chloroflexota bacterium]